VFDTLFRRVPTLELAVNVDGLESIMPAATDYRPQGMIWILRPWPAANRARAVA
jgi:hypothetical protein